MRDVSLVVNAFHRKGVSFRHVEFDNSSVVGGRDIAQSPMDYFLPPTHCVRLPPYRLTAKSTRFELS